MEYRNILIVNPAKIRTAHGQLIITQDRENSIPIEDISSVLIESQSVALSVGAISALADQGVTVFFCDEKHLPSCQVLPMNQFCRQRKLLQAQCAIGKPLQKQLWQQIVVEKIRNQAKCLAFLDRDGVDTLLDLSKSVLSGDTDNREAVAAATYFRALFGDDFRRGDEDGRNSALNYGYAIIRGCIARNLVIHGLEPCIGLHHRSELNNFNLADDLIEPFRPLVDLYVAQNFTKDDNTLTPMQKAGLFNISNYQMRRKDKKYRAFLAVEQACVSLAKCIAEGKGRLDLPELIPLESYRYE